MTPSRRVFLLGGATVAGGAAFAGHWWTAASPVTRAATAAGAARQSFGGWIRIADDGGATVCVPHVDMGQGVHTALAQMVADELDLPWERMAVETAPAVHAFANGALARGWVTGDLRIPSWLSGSTDFTFRQVARFLDLQISGGSTAVRFTGRLGLRVVAAATRQALVEAGARRWGVPAASLRTQDGAVVDPSSGRTLGYGELAADAAATRLSGTPRLRPSESRRLVGQSVPRLDIPAKLDGSLVYGIDVRLPGLRVATVRAAPVHGGRLESVDPAPALAVSGVERVVRLPDAVCVVAAGYWPASRGLAALEPRFSTGAAGAVGSASIARSQAEALVRSPSSRDHEIGDVAAAEAAALRAGGTAIEATYGVPFLHHASMEPPALTAHARPGALEVWGGVQDPLNALVALAKAAGLPLDAVTLHPFPIGGSFGRRLPKSIQPLLEQTVAIAREVPHPVQIVWSREEDVAQGRYRPQLMATLRATLTADGRPASWRSVFVRKNSEEDAAHVPYDIPAQSMRWVDDPSDRPTGAWRAVSHTQHAFYSESFVDELAHAAGRDPLDYRLGLLANRPREHHVLQEAARRSGWGGTLPAGTGRGVALGHGMGTVVAMVIEASVPGAAEIRVHRAVAVVDCGLVVHPDTARQQVEGSIVMGLSAALAERITLEEGAVRERNFTDYPLLRLAETPAIDVHFTGGRDATGGLGEPALPPVAPALANAVFAASGRRLRRLPLMRALAGDE